MIKYLFNHLDCSIIQINREVNIFSAHFPKRAKCIAFWAKGENYMDDIKLPHYHGEGEETAAIQEQINRVNDFQIVSDIFRQIGDTTRIRIFWLLCHCEECVINISAMLEMSSPAVSHHLRPLKNSGLIVCRREGKEVYYRAADTPESRLLHRMIEQVMEIACPKS